MTELLLVSYLRMYRITFPFHYQLLSIVALHLLYKITVARGILLRLNNTYVETYLINMMHSYVCYQYLFRHATVILVSLNKPECSKESDLLCYFKRHIILTQLTSFYFVVVF